ncbi:cell division protein FtsH [Desulfocucumis palustris]|uniref:Cell division protein FtsH n=1 Tax=Desulfocucumis palustris TaxID=1898651 RepID=A0A2L2XF32_9FIRM|nr:CDC48 family AAA ATPase [Desulfocucumis palustris]GBF32441.1 cell division protein FtsH [Desulfocucumis palustris]
MERSEDFIVAESLHKDVGRGIARLDPEDMAGVGAEVGDVVAITGGGTAVARLMPQHRELRGKRVIQLDALLRENAGVGPGDKVRVEKVGFCPAASKIIVSIPANREFRPESDYIRRYLEGLPVKVNNKVQVPAWGSKKIEAIVIHVEPEGIVSAGSGTDIVLKDASPEGAGESRAVCYEDIGGLKKEVDKVREIVELPLKYPFVFRHLGIDPPRGILLSGPPGTGKTLIARAVASEAEAAFFHVSGPEIIHKFYGESEAKLREVFERAQQKGPSIIFLDEIDAIAPKREEVSGEVEKRVVAQLLALMDGITSRGRVVVIGATNIPNSLDPALRRPGRFDREIHIGVPDQKGRRDILQIHTRGMPLDGDVDLELLSGLTAGFTGADLSALCKEAAMGCLREALPRLNPREDRTAWSGWTELKVAMKHFEAALKDIEPSAAREFLVEIPVAGWEQVGGLAREKELLRQLIEWPLKYRELFARAGAKMPRGILLYGPPGTGKTLLARAVANEANANFVSVKGPQLISKWVGESEKEIRKLFRRARQVAPCIIFFDEIDGLAPVRGYGGGAAGEKVVSQLLTEMDGIEGLNNVVVMAATNRIDAVDPALLRSGRFEVKLGLSLPDRLSRAEMFKIHMQGRPLEKGINPEILAERAEGFSGADIEYVCRRAALLAIEEFIRRNPGGANPEHFRISGDNFKEAIGEVQNTPRGVMEYE